MVDFRFAIFPLRLPMRRELFCNNCKLEIANINSKLPEINYTAKQVLDSKIAYQITSMMEGVIQRGTARSLKDFGAVKSNKYFYLLIFLYNFDLFLSQ